MSFYHAPFEYARSYVRNNDRFVLTAKAVMGLLSLFICTVAFVLWFGLHQSLNIPTPAAIVWALLRTIAPPALGSFILPTSPGGMLMQRIISGTWGYAVIVGAFLFLLADAFIVQWSFWESQPAAVETGLVLHQTLIGVIGAIIIPALSVLPVSSDELVEIMRLGYLVRRYEMQANTSIDLLRSVTFRWVQYAHRGLSNLSPAELREYKDGLAWLVKGIYGTLDDFGRAVHKITGYQLDYIPWDRDPRVAPFVGKFEETIDPPPSKEILRVR